MKTRSITFSLITFSILLFSCSKETLVASHEVSSKNYTYSEYTALEVNDNFKVFLSFSDTGEKFEIEANDNLHRHIKTTQVGNKVIVKLDDIDNIIGNETLNIYIKTREIRNIKLNGNTNLTIEDLVSSGNIKVDLTGNCFLKGTVNTGQMNLKARGNCMVDLSGNIDKLEADLSGNCELSDYSLVLEDLSIKLSGNSNAHLMVNNSISMDGNGNSILFYEGNAAIIYQNLSSNSKIIKN